MGQTAPMGRLRTISLAAAVLASASCVRLGFRQPEDRGLDGRGGDRSSADRGRDAPADGALDRKAGDALGERLPHDGVPDRSDAPRVDAVRGDAKPDARLDAKPKQDTKLLVDLKPLDLRPPDQPKPDRSPDLKPPFVDLSKPTDAGTLGAVCSALPATGLPTARRSTSAAVHAQSGGDTIWIFGGFVSSMSIKNDLYSYSTSAGAWTSLPAASPPSPRERHVLAWDPVAPRLVLFGGQYGIVTFTHYDELHTFSLGSNTWTPIPKAGSWPSPRKDAALVWVPHLGKFLLYGGNNGSGASNRLSDLWLLALSGASATWSKLTPGGVPAPAQSGGCVVYDPAGRRLILFGGETQDGVNATTTYQYLLDSNAWQLDVTTSGMVPTTGSFTQCAWDPAAGRLVLYGGQGASGAPVAGAYLYNPGAQKWSALTLKSSANPGPRADGGAVYSPALGGLFWFGGRTGTVSYTNESWLLKLQ